jgi:hypothetical protein
LEYNLYLAIICFEVPNKIYMSFYNKVPVAAASTSSACVTSATRCPWRMVVTTEEDVYGWILDTDELRYDYQPMFIGN